MIDNPIFFNHTLNLKNICHKETHHHQASTSSLIHYRSPDYDNFDTYLGFVKQKGRLNS